MKTLIIRCFSLEGRRCMITDTQYRRERQLLINKQSEADFIHMELIEELADTQAKFPIQLTGSFYAN